LEVRSDHRSASGYHRKESSGVSHDFQTSAVVSLTIALCPDPQCQPSAYRLCAECTAILDESFPEKCAEPDCYACRRGAAEAARAEQ
jgi:hypothetical protein